MLSHAIARRYAKGLLEAVAVIAAGRETNIKEDLASLVEAIDGHDGLKLLIMMNPAVPVQQKKAILGKIMEAIGLDATSRRFVDVLAEKERLDHLSLISDVSWSHHWFSIPVPNATKKWTLGRAEMSKTLAVGLSSAGSVILHSHHHFAMLLMLV